MTATIGLVFLLIVMQNTPRYFSDSEDVRLRAEVKSIRHFGNTTYLDLLVNKDTSAVVYGRVNLTKGEKIEILGTKHDERIIVDEIRKI